MRAYASVPLTNSLPPLSLLEEVLYDLPPLEGVLLHWHTHGAAALTPGIVSLFSRRKHLLGPATLPGTSIQLLATCVEECLPPGAQEAEVIPWEARPLHSRLIRHRHSHSAVETQALLPPGVLVQKTVTLALGELLVLCTGVGTWRLSRQDLHEIAKALGLPNRRSRHATINPESCQTVEAFGMLPGMVSPFLRPAHTTRLAALVVLPWPRCWEAQRLEVAISLSLWESLVIPLACLRPLLRSYACHAYPAMRLVDLSGTEEDESLGNSDACTPSEYDVLLLLLRAAGEPVPFARLAYRDAHRTLALGPRHRLSQRVSRLRARLWPLGLDILCLTGFGYMLLTRSSEQAEGA